MQTNSLEDQAKLEEAVSDLKQHLVGLAGLVAERLKAGAREAIDETVLTAKKKAAEIFSSNEIRSIIRSHPKAAVSSAFGLGALIGVGKGRHFRSSFVAILGLAYELYRSIEHSRPRQTNMNQSIKPSTESFH